MLKIDQEEVDKHFIVNVLEYVTCISTSLRKKVGAILVSSEDTIIGHGYNSLPRGRKDEPMEGEDGKTKPDVIHAERWAVEKALALDHEIKGATLYCTIPPCPACCEILIWYKVKRVVYKEDYWSKENIHLLTDAGIEVKKFQDER